MERIKVITLLSLLLVFNIAIAGCLDEEKPKEKAIELEFMGSTHKVYVGDSTTYIIVLTNNRDLNDSITLTIEGKPDGWDVMLNLTKVNLTEDKSIGIFVVVNASSDAKLGDHKVKIQATSDVDSSKDSVTITTKVIGKDGVKVQGEDKVIVDYLGYFPDYSVFDTSIENIAKDRSIRKIPDFEIRPGYEPFYVYVGSENPDVSDPYGSAVEGFWEAILDMKVGQSRTVVLPPKKAYGEFTNTTLNLTEEVVMTEILSFGEFEEKYPGIDVHEGMVLSHYFWSWNISIDYVNASADVIKILHEPFLNQIVSPHGWESEVIYKNRSDLGGDGRILVEHDVDVGTQGIYQNHSAEVMEIEGEQFKLEYNIGTHPFANEVLIFDITLIEINT